MINIWTKCLITVRHRVLISEYLNTILDNLGNNFKYRKYLRENLTVMFKYIFFMHINRHLILDFFFLYTDVLQPIFNLLRCPVHTVFSIAVIALTKHTDFLRRQSCKNVFVLFFF